MAQTKRSTQRDARRNCVIAGHPTPAWACAAAPTHKTTSCFRAPRCHRPAAPRPCRASLAAPRARRRCSPAPRDGPQTCRRIVVRASEETRPCHQPWDCIAPGGKLVCSNLFFFHRRRRRERGRQVKHRRLFLFYVTETNATHGKSGPYSATMNRTLIPVMPFLHVLTVPVRPGPLFSS
jgi:hypothetical protein